jgi:hypothetical protein
MALSGITLLDLPTELLVEIISYHPYTFDFLSPLVRQEVSKERQPRRKTLHSLSQSCSVLRNITLSFLWERLDVSHFKFRQPFPDREVTKCIFPYIKFVPSFMICHSYDCSRQIRTCVNGILAYLFFRWNGNTAAPHRISVCATQPHRPANPPPQ